MESFDNPSRKDREPRPADRADISEIEAVTVKADKERLNKAATQAWNNLPYTMMRLTAGQAPFRERFYWRDQIVHIGESQLELAKIESSSTSPSYCARFLAEGSKEDLCVCPLLEGDQLHWLAPDIGDLAKFTSEQLAAALLTRLRAFDRPGPSRSARRTSDG